MNNGERPDEPIFRYTIEDAERDGVLFKLSNVDPLWERGFFSHITTNLLNQGYMETAPDGSERIRMPNLVDLLNQVNQPLLRDFKADKLDWFYSVRVEGPDGMKREVYAQLNEKGRYTIMAPEDY